MDIYSDRGEQVRAFAEATRAWIAETRREAQAELAFDEPGGWDARYSIDQLHIIEFAEHSLRALEAELAAMRARGRLRADETADEIE